MDTLYKTPTAGQRLRSSPLGPWLDTFVTRLADRGYPPGSRRSYVVLAADLGRWMAEQGHDVSALDESLIDDYVERRRTQRDRRRVAALHALAHLRDEGVAPPRPVSRELSPLDDVCLGYEAHLRDERGASAGTIEGYLAVVVSFLTQRFGTEPLELEALTGEDVGRFLLARADELSPKRLDYLACSLRSFLRYLFARGSISRDLSAAALGAQKRHPAGLPCHLEPAEVEKLLSTADPGTPGGSRDRAILLLLVRLGLRAGEVAALELDDIRWKSGEIVVRGKGDVFDRLPLPPDVGEALAHYLVHNRPKNASRRVFLRLCAPIRGLCGRGAISTMVRTRLRRAGLHPGRTGAHVLRHTLGTNLIRSGATLTEIGEVLRHHAPRSAEIYARVDLESLRALALPWPAEGGVR